MNTRRLRFIWTRTIAALAIFAGAFAAAQQGASDSGRKITNRVAPAYPEMARSMKVRGMVKLEALVASNGTVKVVKVIGGHPLLAQAAERAVLKWKWEATGHETSEVIELRFNPE